ncbi:Uma2 family endonuclease [Crossiella sp. CA198]|uniref:Uma2 family endonuclease n=1 Tax=Crossiella sp. CA198 TaxID=3455607 RepID=UPI003F8D56B5
MPHRPTALMIGPHTVEDWLALDPPVDGSIVELIYGYLHVTPAPSGERQNIATNLVVLVKNALRTAERNDLYAVTAVNVRISTTWRTALIPDVVILTRKPTGVYFDPADLALAVEVWSPGNKLAERETKMAGYATAGVPFVWTIDQPDDLRALPTLTAYRLEHDQYIAENTLKAAGPVTITASPIPITLDLAELDA